MKKRKYINYHNPNSNAIFEFWKSSLTGRWFWHRKSGGRITDDGSYASRRSCRRALAQRVAKEKKIKK